MYLKTSPLTQIHNYIIAIESVDTTQGYVVGECVEFIVNTELELSVLCVLFANYLLIYSCVAFIDISLRYVT